MTKHTRYFVFNLLLKNKLLAPITTPTHGWNLPLGHCHITDKTTHRCSLAASSDNASYTTPFATMSTLKAQPPIALQTGITFPLLVASVFTLSPYMALLQRIDNFCNLLLVSQSLRMPLADGHAANISWHVATREEISSLRRHVMSRHKQHRPLAPPLWRTHGSICINAVATTAAPPSDQMRGLLWQLVCLQ